MKVALIGDYPPPHGGIAVHVQQLHAYLRGEGVSTQVLDIGKGGRPDPDVLPVHTYGGYAQALVRQAAGGAVLHLHISGNNAKAWLVAASVASLGALAPARVLTVHSGLAPAFLATSWRHRALARAALLGFSRVLAVSPPLAVALRGLGVADERLAVVPAFLSSQVRAGAEPAGFAAVRQRRRPLLAMAHHPSPVYGRALALRALKTLSRTLPDIGLALFGPGSERGALWDEARALGVEDRLEPLGELDHPGALAVMRGADVFLRPTRADGDSISVREALALAVPCVASDVCARPPGTVTFRADDADHLAAQVLRALTGPRQAAAAMPDAGPLVHALYRQLSEFPPSAEVSTWAQKRYES